MKFVELRDFTFMVLLGEFGVLGAGGVASSRAFGRLPNLVVGGLGGDFHLVAISRKSIVGATVPVRYDRNTSCRGPRMASSPTNMETEGRPAAAGGALETERRPRP